VILRLAIFRRIAALVCVALLLSACRIDTTVSMRVERDGSGEVTVLIVANKDIVEQAPQLSEDLNFADLVNVGWEVEGPTPTADGGLQVILSHPFENESQATAVLMQLNGERGPFRDVALTRSGEARDSLWTLSGRLEVTGGLQAFADDQLVEIVGGAPYQATVDKAGLDLGKVIGLTFRASLPGDVKTTTGFVEGTELTWRVATDGTPVDLATTTENVDVVGTIGGVIGFVGRALSVIWVLFIAAVAFLVYRRQNARRTAREARRASRQRPEEANADHDDAHR
jgi:hypothetical protein